MADLLIKGMDMPPMPETFKQAERVPYIDVRIFADGTAVTSTGESPYYTQYSAVPVPPHGRLVDWDEVEKCIEETADCDIKQYALFLVSWAAEKRVVIEASEDGDTDG